jgi:hypothetical protein
VEAMPESFTLPTTDWAASVPRNVSSPGSTHGGKCNRRSGKKKMAKVVQVPVGFTADHLETLYDIDVVHKRYASIRGLTITEYRRSIPMPCSLKP